jgi:hypothetical protein
MPFVILDTKLKEKYKTKTFNHERKRYLVKATKIHKKINRISKKSDFNLGIRYVPGVNEVLSPERKHPLLINLKFSKNSGMIVYHYRTVCKILI